MRAVRLGLSVGGLAAGLTLATTASAVPVVATPFDASYTLVDLGVVPSVPMPYGGLTFKAGDNDTLLIGGTANAPTAMIYSVGVTRDGSGHVTGFSGAAVEYASGLGATAGIDGGLTYGPGGVLFYTTFPDHTLAEIKPGQTTAAKVIQLGPLGYASSVGSLVFVPTGFGGAGRIKILSWTSSIWYDATVSADGSGTYDLSPPGISVAMPGDPEGAVFISAGNPQFSADSVLVSEWNAGRVSAYDIDGNGDPLPLTRKDFVSGLDKAEGAVIDPVTGDFLFSTWGAPNTDHVVLVKGFTCIGSDCSPPDGGVGGAGGSAGGGTGATGGSAGSATGGSAGSATGGSAGSGAAGAGGGGSGGGGSGGAPGGGAGGSGAGSGTGGAAAAGGAGGGGSGSDSGDDGGCGCGLPGSASTPGLSAGLLALLALLRLRSRRRR